MSSMMQSGEAPSTQPEAEAPPSSPALDADVSHLAAGEVASRTDEPNAQQDAKKRAVQNDVVTDGSLENGAAVKKQKTQRDEEVVNGTGDEDVVMDSDEKHTESDDGRADEQTQDIEAFHRELKTGDEVDVFCVINKVWLPAKIEDVTESDVRVHFMGWNKKSDEDIAKTSLHRVAPRGSEAAEGWQKIDAKHEKQRLAKEKKRLEALARLEQAQAEGKKLGSSVQMLEEEAPPVAFVEAGATRSGRRVTKRIAAEGTTIVRKKPSTPAPKKSAEEHAREVQEDNLCGICGEYEDEAVTDMIMCDGGCLNSYHFSCVGIDEVPDEEKWLCEQCRTNEQQCFLCERNGTIGEKGGVFRCCVASCGKFYHQSCVDSHKHFRRMGRSKSTKETTEPTEGDDDNEPEGAFRCPRHVCAVCENSKKAELMQCLKCPEAYHPHCVPPSARYNNLGTLCYRHPHDKLPRIPTQYLVDRNFDSVVVDFNLRLPPLFLPKTEPEEDDVTNCHHFRLQVDVMDQVKKVPPTYRTLVRNIYTFKQQKESLEDVPMCVCKKTCGDDCINRLSFTECFGPAPTPGVVPQKASERKDKESNCPLGEQCGNRALHQRTYPKFERFHTTEKGWGLKVLEPVKAGQLVIEYVGEVINEEEKDRRLSEHARLHPDDKNMYIMELSKGVYIDARHKGSVSRFINHSCDPNCRLLKWNVRGVNRIAITAVKNIAAGEELSYDYQFHTSQALEWRCFCKAKNCRGTMAPEKLNLGEQEPGKKLTKKEMAKKMKRAMLQEKINQKKEEKDTARRLSLTAPIGRTIARTGPVPRELIWAKSTHVFLKRNAERGFDFLRRRQLMDERITQAASKRTQEASVKAEDTASTASTEEEMAPSKIRLKVVSQPLKEESTEHDDE